MSYPNNLLRLRDECLLAFKQHIRAMTRELGIEELLSEVCADELTVPRHLAVHAVWLIDTSEDVGLMALPACFKLTVPTRYNATGGLVELGDTDIASGISHCDRLWISWTYNVGRT